MIHVKGCIQKAHDGEAMGRYSSGSKRWLLTFEGQSWNCSESRNLSLSLKFNVDLSESARGRRRGAIVRVRVRRSGSLLKSVLQVVCSTSSESLSVQGQVSGHVYWETYRYFLSRIAKFENLNPPFLRISNFWLQIRTFQGKIKFWYVDPPSTIFLPHFLRWPYLRSKFTDLTHLRTWPEMGPKWPTLKVSTS